MPKIPKSNKAQINITIIIIVLMVFLLIYLYYLPDYEKEKLFGNNNLTNYSSNITSNQTGIKILELNIGRIYAKPLNQYEHTIQSFSAHYIDDFETFAKTDEFYIFSNIFDRNTKEIKFNINHKLLSNLYVALNIIKTNSDMKFYLNNHLVYVGRHDFTIDKELLRKQNTLKIIPIDTGINVIGNNYARLSLKLFARVENAENAIQKVPIFLETQEKLYCEKGILEYFLDCTDNPKNHISLSINNHILYNNSPDCRRLYKFNIDCNYLKQGTNNLIIKSQHGNYFINSAHLTIKTQNNISEPIYFDIPKDIYKNLKQYKIKLIFEFIKQTNNNLYININGFEREMKAKDFDYVINPYLKEKNNYLTISSDSTINIPDLKIVAIK